MPTKKILLALIVCVCIIVTVIFIHEAKKKEQWELFLQTQKIQHGFPDTLPDVLQNYIPVEMVGYGFSQHKSGTRKFGITIRAYGGRESLIVTSEKDVRMLEMLKGFLGTPSNIQQDFYAYAQDILRQANALLDTQYIFFEMNQASCQTRFRNKTNKVTCLSVTDATAICMVFSRIQHMPFIFAHKGLFSKEYLESLFTTNV